MLRKILFILCFFPVFLFAQAPQGLSYQAIAWDKSNLPKVNLTVTVTFNIRSLKIDGAIEYTETQTAKTNQLGYFTLTIGETSPTAFKAINWANGPKFLEVIVDGVASGTTQMLSVPYAMYAENTSLKAGSGIDIQNNTISNLGDGDNDSRNELQELKLTGTNLELSGGGGSVDLSKIPLTQYKMAPSTVNYDPTFLGEVAGTSITIPAAGTYLIQASIEFKVPENGDSQITQLKVGGVSTAAEILDSSNETGFFFLNGFYIFSLKANEVVSIKYSSLFFNTTEKGFYRNALIFLQKIN